MNHKLFFISCILLLFMRPVWGQNINIVAPTDMDKTCDSGEHTARVDFISTNADLLIDENGGTPGEPVQKRGDGKYIYTFLCDVMDTNKFKFNVSVQGVTGTQSVAVFIKEGEFREYGVEVEEISASIGEINVSEQPIVVPKENTAMAIVTSIYPKLYIESVTGEKTEGPNYDEVKRQFTYTVSFDLSSEESRSKVRSLRISANNKDFLTQDLGALSPKQGVDIAVLVIQESCYQQQINMAKNCFLNGAYKDAWQIYKQIVETDQCPDKPSDLAGDKENMTKMHRLAAALIKAHNYYVKAERFQANGEIDSCMYYQAESYKYRNYILKSNASDPYCLEYNRKFDLFKETIPRMVSGKVVDNSRMDRYNRNLPIKDVYIVLSVHERDYKNVNGVKVPAYGKEIDKNLREYLGKTDEKGLFKVPVKRNTKDEIYVLNFSADENFTKASHEYKYMPKDVDVEADVVVKISPKSLNTYNK